MIELKPIGHESFAAVWQQDYITGKILTRYVAREQILFILQSEGLDPTMKIIAELINDSDHLCACEDMALALQAHWETKNVLFRVFR